MLVATLRPRWVEHGSGARPWLRLAIHDTDMDLQRAGNRARSYEDHGEAVGLFQPAPWREFYDRPSRRWLPAGNGLAGTIRLSREHLTTEIVAHECTHAAAHLYRRYHKADGSLGDNCGEDEETFAFYLGEVVAMVNNALHDLGVFESAA